MTQLLKQTDHQVKTVVTDELAWASNVNADHIGVCVVDGAVTLNGQVSSYPEKTAAVAAVLAVQGVNAVADELVVKSPYSSRDDAAIAAEAGTILRVSTTVPDAVKATVRDHGVTLTGKVAWNYQRDAAEHLVAQLPGVHSVWNRIKVVPRLQFAADEAEQHIRAALLRNAQTQADQIHVSITGSEIELTGTVRTFAEQNEAVHIAWHTPGVTMVHNRLRITG
jgi:osmotically-inducible protein OsmY